MAYGFNDDRSKAEMYTAADLDDIIPVSDFSSANTVKDYIDTSTKFCIDNNVIVDFEKVFELEVPSTHYTQGACTDGTYIYAYITPSDIGTEGLMKLDFSGNIINTVYYSSYPNIGHGNSIYYDNTLNCVVVVSSNGYITEIDPSDLSVINQRAQPSGNYLSQFVADASYGFGNYAGTNTYILYNRIDNHFFTSYGTVEILGSRGPFNCIHDICLEGDFLYSLSSKVERATTITCFGVNGAFVCNYIVNGIDNTEMQGIFTANSKFYIIDYTGVVYTCNVSSMTPQLPQLGTRPNSQIQRCINFSSANYTYNSLITSVQEFTDVDISNAGDGTRNMKVLTKVPYANKGYREFYNDETPMYYSVMRMGYVFQTSSGALRCMVPFCGLMLYMYYTISGNHQYLSKVELYNNSSCIATTGTLAEDASNIATKLRDVFVNSTQNFDDGFIANNQYLRIGSVSNLSVNLCWLYI